MSLRAFTVALVLLFVPVSHLQAAGTAGTIGTVYLHPTGMSGTRAGADPSNPWDMGGNVWWKHNWAAFDESKARDLALVKEVFAEHPRTLLMVYFPVYLADTMYGETYLQRLQTVVEYFTGNGIEVMLFFGRPEIYGEGTWAQAHDPVASATAREYLLANIDRTLRYGTIPSHVDLASVYYLGWSSLCPKTEQEIHAYNVAIKATINAAGMQFVHHVDGPFWEKQSAGAGGTWFECGYTPFSIAASSGASDGLFAESWTQGSLVPGVQRLLSEGRFTAEQILLMNDVPNCDDAAVQEPCAYESQGYTPAEALVKDDATWFDWIDYLGLKAWSVWCFSDGAADDVNAYGDVKNDGTALTPKGLLHRAEALQWKGQAPVTSITAPASQATVSGMVTVTATASDDVGVTSLAIRIDGVEVESAANATSLSHEWDTTQAAAGAHTIVSVATDAVGHVVTSEAVTVTVFNGLSAPANLVAAAAGTSEIDLTWDAVFGATGYHVYRRSSGGYSLLATAPSASFQDTSVEPSTTYLYYVEAVDATTVGPASDVDVATTVLFTDETLAGGSVKAAHVTELRTAVNAFRAAAGLGAYIFTDASLAGAFVKAIHVSELRDALAPAFAPLSRAAPPFTDATLAGVSVKAVHLEEIRSVVR